MSFARGDPRGARQRCRRVDVARSRRIGRIAAYNHKNLKSVEDGAPKFGMEGMEARFATRDLEADTAGVSYQRLDPKVRMPFGHTHEKQEEIYVIVSGSGRAKVGDDVVELKQWDALRVSPGTMRSFEAGSDGLELLAFGAPSGLEDFEIVQGWWSD